ncbi:MAG: hypothetical protein KDF56_10550, partial [Ottowia sp.]|nr:hypothetical protein [Ottowia sp.]
TRVISRSEWLGFPPFAARADRAESPELRRFGAALRRLDSTVPGREALSLLFLDRIAEGDVSLFEGIGRRMAEIARQ